MHWQYYDQFFQRKPVRHLTTRRSSQETVRSSILQSGRPVQGRNKGVISGKHAGSACVTREVLLLFRRIDIVIEPEGVGIEPALVELESAIRAL
jgi:hypothetical protein